MKKSYIGIIFICLFVILVGCSIKIFKTPAPSPAHTLKTVSEKIYSENLTKICSKLIYTFNMPEDVKISTDKVSVYLMDTTAIVDFGELPDFSKNFQFEQFFIYSIVNTLTKENGVMTVKFTVNGKNERSFNGEIDMAETFIPDYNIVPEIEF